MTRFEAHVITSPKELRDIEKLVEENQDEIELKWNEFFNNN